MSDNGSAGKSGWVEGTYGRSVQKAPERDYPFDTSDGMQVDPLYSPEDLDGWDYLEQLGFPGEFPFTRGVQPTMYRGRLWTMRQYAGFGDAEESNQRYRYLLGQGQTGLSVAFDLPTQIGYDSDHPMAAGEVGKVGVAIASLADMELLMKDISLEKVTTSMTINATGAILLAFYVALARKQGADLSKVGGDPERHPRNHRPRHHIFRRKGRCGSSQIPSPGKNNLPRKSPSASWLPHARPGTAIRVAFTANAVAYRRRRQKDSTDIRPRLHSSSLRSPTFLKRWRSLRGAANVGRIAKERYGAKDQRSMMLASTPRRAAQR